MRTIPLFVVLVLVLGPISSADFYAFCSETEEQPAECVRGLVANWSRRDGAGHEEFSTKLALSFAAHPRLVLRELAKVPADFDAWLEDLGGNTFYVFDRQGTVSGDMLGAADSKLRDLMLKEARSLSADSDYADSARRLLAVLEAIEISWME